MGSSIRARPLGFPIRVLAVAWAGDALTATLLDSARAVVYVDPGLDADTFLYFVNFKTKNVTNALIGGDQGELRCLSNMGKLRCYGVVPGGDPDSDPTQLIEVDGETGDSKPVLNLTKYEGFSMGGSVVDPANQRYHFIAVGAPHNRLSQDAPASSSRLTPKRRCRHTCPAPESALPSDQWLVTVDLRLMTLIAETPVSRDFMGPLSVSRSYGLATLNAEGYTGLVSVDYKSGLLKPLILGDFGGIYQFAGAFSRDDAYAVTIYPQPTRLFAIHLPADGTPVVTTNTTFNSTGFVYAALW